MRINLGFAPWVDDPDPPDEMTDEEIERAAEAAAEVMRKRKGVVRMIDVRASEDVDYIKDPATGRFEGSRPHHDTETTLENLKKLPEVESTGSASKEFRSAIERHFIEINTKYPKLISIANLRSIGVYAVPSEYDQIELTVGPRFGKKATLPDWSCAAFHRSQARISAFESEFRVAEEEKLGRGRNMILHELGHAYDYARHVSHSVAFRAAWVKDFDIARVEAPNTLRQFAYFVQQPTEAFAESVARLLGPDLIDSADFKRAFPRGLKVVEDALKKDGIIDDKPSAAR